MRTFDAFRCEAKKEGITIDVNESGARFVFDFNEGQIATPKDVLSCPSIRSARKKAWLSEIVVNENRGT